MKVTNRSDGNLTYTIDEMRTRRVFTPNETKEIDAAELEALFQMDGGTILIKHFLLVEDKEWVAAHWDAPLEYFWTYQDVENCVKEDSLELFSETLDFAPLGVIDLIKQISWKLPLNDLNKIRVIQEKLGFDVQAAIEAMKTSEPKVEPKTAATRLRRG